MWVVISTKSSCIASAAFLAGTARVLITQLFHYGVANGILAHGTTQKCPLPPAGCRHRPVTNTVSKVPAPEIIAIYIFGCWTPLVDFGCGHLEDQYTILTPKLGARQQRGDATWRIAPCE
jgi:hypothetical protein